MPDVQIANPELDKLIRDWADTKAKVAEMSEALEELKKEAEGQQKLAIALMDQMQTATRTVDGIIVKVNKRSEGGVPKYKDGFTFLLGKVNKDLQVMADNFLESTKGSTWVRQYLTVSGVKKESIMKRIWQAIEGFLREYLNRMTAINADIAALEGHVLGESARPRGGVADAMIEAAWRGGK
jgi:hypothetical protein